MVKNFVCRTCLTVIHSEDHAHNINEGNITRKLKIKTLVLSYISEIVRYFYENFFLLFVLKILCDYFLGFRNLRKSSYL